MSNYEPVKKALEEGAEPRMLCMTCPWDRFCITPPSMTAAEVKQKIDEASEKDKADAAKAEAEGKPAGMPIGMLVTTVAIAGRDTSCSVCPVFALRLRSGAGGQMAQGIKAQMLAWDDAS